MLVREGENAREHERKEKEKRPKGRNGHVACLVLFRDPPFASSLSAESPRFPTFSFCLFAFFSSRPTLRSFSHYRDEPTMKITSTVVVSYTLRKPITVSSLSMLDARVHVCVYVNAWSFCFCSRG